ncbi:MAG: triose-phosphate isomerase [Pseudomonadota bacterium]
MARRLLIAGNWKLNGSFSMVDDLLGGLAGNVPESVDCAVFPPAPYIKYAVERLDGTGIACGSQDVSEHDAGAHTGELSGAMVVDAGGTHTLCGHSERRADHLESSEMIGRKMVAALRHGLTPVLCVGETLEEREAGDTETVVLGQLEAAIGEIGIEGLGQSIVAYEPVWAIGTGRTATPDQAQAVHAAIRSKIAAADATIAGRIRILYGGSVKGSNAAELFGQPDIDGALVGGASLEADSFLAICRAVPVTE